MFVVCRIFANPKVSHLEVVCLLIRYPDEDAGEIPMAYVVRKPGININEAQVIDFVAKKACFSPLFVDKKIRYRALTCHNILVMEQSHFAHDHMIYQ